MRTTREAIRSFVLEHYLPGESPDNLRDETPLRSSGILDSLATLGLVAFLEERFGIELDVFETGLERFDRIEEIAEIVERKRCESARLPGGKVA